MLNIGVRAHDFGKMNPKELSESVSRYGFGHIQLALKKAVAGISDDHGKLSPGMGNYLEDCFLKKGIRISVLGCYINPVHPDSRERAIHLERFTEHLLYARSFGCSIVGTETGSPLPDCSYTDRIYNEETFQDFIASLRVLVAAAEKTGTIAAIEGVADKNCIYSHERLKRTLELIPSPNLGIIYDPVNFLPSSREKESDGLMKEAFEMFAPKIVAVHAKDYRMENGRKDGTLPAGRGKLNYHLLLDLIRFYKPWVPVLLENNSPGTMEESLGFIKSIEKELTTP
ncbi:MAG: sugar phosphate isomerase/epimerase [Spirochaetales bacterium]|nr:sugar phosphate isomerase/epimerase [Spirochaetales bacterium]